MRANGIGATILAAAFACAPAFGGGPAAAETSPQRYTIRVADSHDSIRVLDVKGRTLVTVAARAEEGFAPYDDLQPERAEQLSLDGRWLRVRAYAASNVGPARRYTFLVFVPTGERIDLGGFPAAFGVKPPDVDFTFVPGQPATIHIDYQNGTEKTLVLPRTPRA